MLSFWSLFASSTLSTKVNLPIYCYIHWASEEQCFFRSHYSLCYWRQHDENHVIELSFAVWHAYTITVRFFSLPKLIFHSHLRSTKHTLRVSLSSNEPDFFRARAHIDICLLNLVYKPQFIRAFHKTTNRIACFIILPFLYPSGVGCFPYIFRLLLQYSASSRSSHRAT